MSLKWALWQVLFPRVCAPALMSAGTSRLEVCGPGRLHTARLHLRSPGRRETPGARTRRVCSPSRRPPLGTERLA